MTHTRQQGSDWESAAESFLNGRGLQTVEKNYHGRFGEIDLVMLDGGTLVFVEVRYRASDRFGGGAASVTPVKQRRIILAAQRFLQSRRQFAGSTYRRRSPHPADPTRTPGSRRSQSIAAVPLPRASNG